MKKQKFMKLTAHTAEPDLANSFAFPATHNAEISIVFGGKDISVHGYDGSVWTTLHTWDGESDQFTADNWVHQYTNFYLKSLTGSDEIIRVSFFSAEKYQGSTPSLAGINRDVKLYDVDEVPIYTASDDGKFLTIRSDGSLAWLGADESFTVESEGGEEGGGGGDIPGIFIEELPSAANNIFRPVYNSITNGIFTQTSPSPGHKGGTKVDLDVEGILDYSGNSLDPKEWTLSFWVAAESVISAGHNYCGGRFEANKELRLAMGKTGDGFMQFKPIIGNLWTGTPKAKSAIPFAVGQFQHCAITYGLSPGHTNKYDLKIFIDGVKGGEALQKSFHVLDKNADGALFGIGKATSGATFIGNGGAFSLDSVQIAQGALTEPQVAAIAAQTDRQMGIEAASLL